MKRSLITTALAGCAALGSLVATGAAARAELHAGDRAPAFVTQASLGGHVFSFDLAAELRRGPVVLYFYPAAFTSGCTVEAHDFAEHVDEYKKLGATVVGVSGDKIEKLNRFSVSECRSKFAVASDGDHRISKAYKALLGFGPVAFSDRTSYVIAPDGTIAYAYRSLDPARHVANTLDAVRRVGADATHGAPPAAPHAAASPASRAE
ncbi:MAG: peroxiredoxin [Vulcanimicrobiaceae bacterium]